MGLGTLRKCSCLQLSMMAEKQQADLCNSSGLLAPCDQDSCQFTFPGL